MQLMVEHNGKCIEQCSCYWSYYGKMIAITVVMLLSMLCASPGSTSALNDSWHISYAKLYQDFVPSCMRVRSDLVDLPVYRMNGALAHYLVTGMYLTL